MVSSPWGAHSTVWRLLNAKNIHTKPPWLSSSCQNVTEDKLHLGAMGKHAMKIFTVDWFCWNFSCVRIFYGTLYKIC